MTEPQAIIDYPSILESAMVKMFPNDSVRLEVADAFRNVSCPRGWNARVCLAILKICGSDLESIRGFIADRHEHRDIVSMAEYEQSGRNWELRRTNPGRYRELVNQDWNAYNALACRDGTLARGKNRNPTR